MILLIIVVVKPDTYFNILLDAVFMFTPTSLTIFETVKSKFSVNFFWSTSCWYSPIPILLGSIFTSSLNGSCTRLPMLTALRSCTSKSGNSFCAYLLAEYTDAPASETIV